MEQVIKLEPVKMGDTLTVISTTGKTIVKEIFVTRKDEKAVYYTEDKVIKSYEFDNQTIMIRGINLGIKSSVELIKDTRLDLDLNIGGLPFEKLRTLIRINNLNPNFTNWKRLMYFTPRTNPDGEKVPLFPDGIEEFYKPLNKLSHLMQDSPVTLIYSNGITCVKQVTFCEYEKTEGDHGIYFHDEKGRNYFWIDNMNILILRGHMFSVKPESELSPSLPTRFDFNIRIGGLSYERMQKLLKENNCNEYFTGWDKLLYLEQPAKEKKLFPDYKKDSIENYLTKQSFELISLYLNARNYYNYLQPIVDSLQKEVLAEMNAKAEKVDEVILNPKNMYHLKEEDRKLFDKKYQQKLKEKNFNHPFNWCPLSDATLYYRQIIYFLAYHFKTIYPGYKNMNLERMVSQLEDSNYEKIYNKYERPVSKLECWIEDILKDILPGIKDRIEVLPESEAKIIRELMYTKSDIPVKLKDDTVLTIYAGSLLANLSLSNKKSIYLNDYLWFEKYVAKGRDYIGLVSASEVIIPESELQHVINLVYNSTDTTNKFDIYTDANGKSYYRIMDEVNKNMVKWTASCKSGESCLSIPPETVVIIQRKDGLAITAEELKIENDCVSAKKRFPFSFEDYETSNQYKEKQINEYKEIYKD